MAIFSEAQRYGGYVGNAFAILESATYLTEEEGSVYVADVPVAENSRIGHYTVKFDDIERLAESYGCDYIDAMLAVAEHNQIDPSSLACVVDEADIISDPSIVYGLANVVVAPLSENSLAAQYCDAVVDAYMESGDDEFLYYSLVEDACLEEFLTEGAWKDTKDYGSKMVDHATDAVKKGWEWVKDAVNKGRNWISKKISWLRNLYAKLLHNANAAEKSGKNKGVIGTLKTVATKIANIIDALLEKLAIVIRNSDTKEGKALKTAQDAQSKYINAEKGAKNTKFEF